MSTKHKTEIRQHDDTLTTIITKASNVLYKDGTTAQDKLDDRNDSMFTQKIENSSSMFKVGQGGTVDFSENVASGAFESCTLHGRTLVNYNQEGYNRNEYVVPPSGSGQNFTLNDTIEGHVKSAILTGQTLINLSPFTRNNGVYELNASTHTKSHVLPMKLQQNKRYIFIFKLTNSQSSENSNYIMCRGLLTDGAFKEFGRKTQTLPNGRHWFMLSSNEGDIDSIFVGTNFDVTLSDTLIIEYQDGMENWDIPYFTGMQSVKMPVLKTTGKNLFDGNMEVGTIQGNAGNVVPSYNTRMYTPNFIPVSSKSVTASTTSGLWVGVFGYDKNKNYLGYLGNANGVVNYTNESLSYVRLSTDDLETYHTIQLEEGSVATPYEPFKSNILTANEDVELRGIGDVRDELDCLAGEVTERIGEVVLDGTQSVVIPTDFGFGTVYPDSNYSVFRVTHGQANAIDEVNLLDTLVSNCLKYVTWVEHQATPQEGISNFHKTSFTISVLKSRLEEDSISGFKQWLQSNPITVQYRLETETIKTVVLSDNVVYSYDEVTHYDCSSEEGSLVPTLSIKNEVSYKTIIKPSTKYSVVFNHTKIGEPLHINLGGTEVGVTSTIGKNIVTITTPSTLSHEYVKFIGTSNKVKDVQVIEGDVVGDEPYFEGMIDCKSPILSNVGKNLFTTSDKNITGTFGVEYSIDNNEVTVWKDELGWYNVRLDWFNLVPNQKYCLSHNTEIISGNPYDLILIKNDKEETIYPDSNGCFISPDNGKVALRFYSGTDAMKGKIRYYNIQLEQVTKPTSYECYKSNILSCETYFDETTQSDKTIVLRSLPNGVCDTLNVETGEYVQRIGERTLNGSESWGVWQQGGDHLAQKTVVGFGLKLDGAPTTKNFYVLCDYFATGGTISGANDDHTYYVYHKELIYGYCANASTYRRLGLSVSKTKLGIPNDSTDTTQALAGLRTYLASNPITVQYELETPIVSTIDVQGFPYAYANGHVQLSSAHDGYSLTPKVEYSVVTNRNGQIRSNQRMVERHEKKLNQLQEMILVNVIDTQYRQTLTSLNYELTKVGEKHDL